MKSYKAIVVAGEFKDPKVARCLADYEKSGGKVVRLPDIGCRLPDVACQKETVRQLMAGKLKFPKMEAIFEGLQRDYFPFKVEGDCLYGANRTADGWWLWVFNNKGVTKFTDTPPTVDRSFDADIVVSGARHGISAVKELLAEKTVPVAAGTFSHRIAAGDLAVFEIK